MMFKVLVIQTANTLSDERTEECPYPYFGRFHMPYSPDVRFDV